MHGLGEGLVEPVQGDEDLGVAGGEVLRTDAVEGTLGVDGMDDRPGQGQEGDVAALEAQLVVGPTALAAVVVDAREEDARRQTEDLTASPSVP